MLACFKSWQALLNDNMPAAISNADESIALCKKIGVPNFHMHALISKALGLNKMRQFHSAMSCIREIRENVNGTKSPLFDFTLLLIEADATAGINDHEKASETLLARHSNVGR